MRIHFLLFALLVQYAVSDFQSPISISDVQCASYNVFNIQMSDLTTTAAAVGAIDTTINGYKIPYTGASVTYNTTEFTSQYLTFRTPSEHILPQVGTNSAAELQIVMTSGDQTAVLSFLVRNLNATSATSTNNLAAYFNSPYANVLSGFTSTNWQFNLNTLGQIISNKSASSQFLNIYTYDGTLTFGDFNEATWFVYGTEILATSDVITTLKTLNGGNNNRATTGSHVVGRMCFTGFFNVDMGDNFGLWFGVVSILLFFIFTLTTGDKPITDPDYEEDVWTHHPLVSVYKYGDELHTRKTRCALILVMVTVNALFCSVFYRTASDPTLATNIILFAVYSMLIDSVVTFLVGNLLRRYYLAKHQFAKTHEEAWEQRSQNRLFAYYIAVFIVVVVGWSFTVWNMGELHPEVDAKPSKLWVASFFVALGLEFAFMYPIGVALAKSSSGMRKLLKRVGFMHDHICHETYMDYIKQE